jgi:hypothetical protein
LVGFWRGVIAGSGLPWFNRPHGYPRVHGEVATLGGVDQRLDCKLPVRAFLIDPRHFWTGGFLLACKAAE